MAATLAMADEDAMEHEYSAANVAEAALQASRLTDEKGMMSQEELKGLPFVRLKELGAWGREPGELWTPKMVRAKSIFSTVAAPFKNWATEYEARKGRAEELRTKILGGTELDVIFHTEELGRGPEDLPPSGAIALLEIQGPAGPIFIVEDGSHRTGAAKFSRMEWVPSSVVEAKLDDSVFSRDRSILSYWDKCRELGLIEGEAEEGREGGMEYWLLNLESRALPWIAGSEGPNISAYYEQLYPGSLDAIAQELGLPKEVLLSKSALFGHKKEK